MGKVQSTLETREERGPAAPAAPALQTRGAAAAAPVSPAEIPTLVIEARSGWVPVDWRELFAFRELFYFLCWRDLKVRYKQTLLGASWAVLTPLFNTLLFSLIFVGIAKMSTEGRPTVLFFGAATVPWALFSTALNSSANSLVGSAYLIKKIYFPRLYIPMAGVAVAVVDFVIAMAVLLILALAMGFNPGLRVLWLPPLVLLALAASLGAGLWLAALMVLFRDVRNMIGFGVQAWMYATPVAYSRTAIPEKWRFLWDYNPMTPVAEGFRWALLDLPCGPTPMWGAGAAVALLLLVSGLYFFRRMERTFADIS